jgi:hypothetical protein
MNAARKRSGNNSLVHLRQLLLNPLAGSNHRFFVVLALFSLPVIGGFLAWSKWGPMITGQPRYVLEADSLEIPPQPSWIQADVKAEVMRDGSLTGMSILDPELTKRIVRAFELHTWVAKVDWVGKRPGGEAPRVIVRLRYREPAVMVKTNQGYQGFWPVDTDGVLLPPNEFSPNQTHSYLRVLADESLPAGPVGTSFGDEGVIGAAKVAAAFREIWRQIGLEWIKVQWPPPRNMHQAATPDYVLFPSGIPPEPTAHQWTSNRSTGQPHVEVHWGSTPGQEQPGEAQAEEKIARLKQFVQKNGPLDRQSVSMILDLRPATGISISTPSP